MRRPIGALAALLAVPLTAIASRGAGPFPESPLDHLQSSAIPAEELELAGPGKPPAELVAILGSGKFAHWGDITDIIVSPDGRCVVTAGDDRVVRVWDLTTGRQLWRIDDEHRHTHGITFSPNGRILATTVGLFEERRGLYSVVDLWEFPGGKKIRRLAGGAIHDSVAFNRDGALIAAANESEVVVWNAQTG